MGYVTGKLTATGVEKLAKTPGLYGDGGNLYLLVRKSTVEDGPPSASWIVRYMQDGKGHTMGLGSLEWVGLAKAREKRDEAMRLLKGDGIDPVAARRATREATRTALAKAMPARTFAQVAEEWIAQKAKTWKDARDGERARGRQKAWAAKIIGNRPVADVDRALVLAVLTQPIKDKDGTGPLWEKRKSADRLRRDIEAILNFAVVHHYRAPMLDGNPAAWRGNLEATGMAKPRTREADHFAWIPWQEIPDFMAKLRASDHHCAPALEFTLLCSARPTEVCDMTWGELDLSDRTKATWTKPNTKNGFSHMVALSDRAVEILLALPGANERDPKARVFPAAKGGPLDSCRLDRLFKSLGRTETPHGTGRGSFSTWAHEAPEAPVARDEDIERCLGHRQKGVAASYNHAKMTEALRPLRQAWSDFCMGRAA